MNLREFNALKIGDKVENGITSGEGTVSAVQELRTGRVVLVKWGATGIAGGVEFTYPVQSTAWTHWNVAPDHNEHPGDKP